MSSILKEILATKREEVAKAKLNVSADRLRTAVSTLPMTRGFASSVLSAPFPSVIAEIKRGSPSLGLFAPELNPEATAKEYFSGGAAAISVLTDNKYFSGDLNFIRPISNSTPQLPLLRKDFIIDEYQLLETRAAGADATLLIVAAFVDESLSGVSLAQGMHQLRGLISSGVALQLDLLLEVHSLAELDLLLDVLSGLPLETNEHLLLGVNNRDLNTFSVSLKTTINALERLKESSRSNSTISATSKYFLRRVVAESGISSAEQLIELSDAGACAFLIGEGLIRSGQPGVALTAICDSARQLMREQRE